MRGVAHMFSGGVDSTLAASLLSDEFEEVHLLTFTRPGFFAAGKALSRLDRLRDRHPSTKITHRFLDVEPFYNELAGGWSDLRRHGVLSLAPCGVCKVSMHWRMLLYCLEHGLTGASDGAAHGAEEYAEQNPRILMGDLAAFYRAFGVEKLSLSFRPGEDNEEVLYRRGIAESPSIKRTPEDEQVLCAQQALFAMTMRAYLSRRGFEDYEKEQRTYLAEKLRHAERLTRRHLEGGSPDHVRELLERAVRA
ncbi:MAG: hypothetical protein Q8T11_15200 [Elusimicrobiota bacterium]|nr:hypothetical protein [Elusimicrobiota bacterium]